MQRSRRSRIRAKPLSAIARPDATGSGRAFRSAKVTDLGDYINRHVNADSEDPPSKARKSNGGVLVIGRELGNSLLAPRRNLLLGSLDAEVYADLLPHLELVALPQGWVICEAGDELDFAYFPISGIVSILYELQNGASLEVALAGNDGLIGVQAFMGARAATSRAVVRNTGHGYRIRTDVLKEKFESCRLLRHPLLRYAHALIAQTTQTAACHCYHRVEQQFSRLLLLTLDRLTSNEVALTQDAMSHLLGVRRESITATAGTLQAAGLIRYHRGRITVLNRPLLEARSCECYAVVRSEFDCLNDKHDSVPIEPGYAVATAQLSRVPFERSRRSAHPHHNASRLV